VTGNLLFLSLIVPGLVTHVGLYGWREAPRDRVQLTARQWQFVLAIAAGPTLLAGAIVSPWRTLLVPIPPERYGLLLTCCALALGSIIWGMMPSQDEDG
jgi:hypothetical protein